MVTHILKSAHNQVSASRIQQMGLILDHLVDALGGDPSAPLRRAQILVDIDQYPDTTQSTVLERLHLNKSTLNREIEWLYDQGCILRHASPHDGRVIHMSSCGYAKKNLGLALDYFKGSHQNLHFFLETLINLFTDQKPTLRDAKFLVAAADMGDATKQELFSRGYSGAQTTNVRAIDHLVEQGLLIKNEESENG
jgi:DNA-binding MarR family transcriptional regulator